MELPAEVLAALGGESRIRVTGLLNGVEFASSTMPIGGGRVCLGVHKAIRVAASVGFGDVVTIEVGRDDRPRVLQIPPELQAALDGDPGAAAAFTRLSFSHRREYVEWIAGAKRAETQARRVAQTLDRLRDS